MMDSTISRKERDRLLREEDFLKAAEQLFSERGYFETSIEDVAREAEYATGTIYRYFSSKEELYHSLLLRKGQAYFDQIKTSLEEADSPLDKLRAVVRGKTRFFFENRKFMRIYMNEVSRPPQGARCRPPEELKHIHEQYLQKLREIFQVGMEQGVFRKLNLEMVLSSMVGFTNELLHSWLERDFQYTEDEIEKFVFDFFKGGLIEQGGEA